MVDSEILATAGGLSYPWVMPSVWSAKFIIQSHVHQKLSCVHLDFNANTKNTETKG